MHDASEKFHASRYGHNQRTNRQYSLSNSDYALCEAKAICGATSPRVTVLALFYESVNRFEKEQHDWNKNKLDKRIKTTNPSKIDAIAPRICGSLILCLILVY